MSKLRVGLIGFGSWVRKAYLPALQYDGRAVITAVTAATEKTRQLAGEILGNNVAAFDSYEDLLSHGDFDAVMIAVPDSVHQAVLTAALQREVAIFYEPPISHIRGQIPVMINRLSELRYRTMQHPEWIVEHISPLKPYADWPGVRENISSFLDCVISGELSQGNAQTVAQLNLIGLASDKSIDTRGWVEVEKINLSK